MEQWKAIPGYEGRYQVSSLGRVKSLARLVHYPDGRRPYRIQTQLLRQQLSTHGYPTVDLSLNGQRQRIGVHILVCRVFHGEGPTGYEVCHNDGDPVNNLSANLRWGTREDNMADRKIHGSDNGGERNGQSKLTEAQAHDVKRRSFTCESFKQIAKDYGISARTVSDIKHGRRWAHLEV